MTRADIIITLGKMLTVNQKEVQAVKEAIAILLDTEWHAPEIELPTTDEFVLALCTGGDRRHPERTLSAYRLVDGRRLWMDAGARAGSAGGRLEG